MSERSRPGLRNRLAYLNSSISTMRISLEYAAQFYDTYFKNLKHNDDDQLKILKRNLPFLVWDLVLPKTNGSNIIFSTFVYLQGACCTSYWLGWPISVSGFLFLDIGDDYATDTVHEIFVPSTHISGLCGRYNSSKTRFRAHRAVTQWRSRREHTRGAYDNIGMVHAAE